MGLDLGDPRWFLDNLVETVRASFVQASRASLGAKPFLASRWDRTRLPTAALAGADRDAPIGAQARLHFVWHTSYCCSTTGEARRGCIRQLFISLAADGQPQSQWPLTNLLGLSDLRAPA